jgi:methylmalonyl-CoA/ethylmalonyl-CoA epimerase
MFKGLDHVAVVVPDTEKALGFWRDRCGFPVLLEEVTDDGALLLTHLDLGNTRLQLMQPLDDGHPLWDRLKADGPGLHHLCFAVDDVGSALEETARMGVPANGSQPHRGTQGKRAAFLDKGFTGGVQVEFTGE